jgi:hypothetical protein
MNLFDQEVVVNVIEGTDTIEDRVYRIVSQNTLDFTTVGAPNNTVGTVFIATSVDTLGSGDVLSRITESNRGIPDVYTWPALAGIFLESGSPLNDTMYRIMAQNIVDFTTIGAPDNNVGTSFFTTGTGVVLSAVDSLRFINLSWKPNGANLAYINETENALTIEYVNDNNGGAIAFKDEKDLFSNLVINRRYKITVEMKVSVGSTVRARVYNGSVNVTHAGNIAETYTFYEYYFTAFGVTSCQFAFSTMGGTDIVFIRNIAITEVGKGSGGMGLGMTIPFSRG